jgi:hypothetical protein
MKTVLLMKTELLGLTTTFLLGLSIDAATAQTPVTFAVDASGHISFVTPSHNIGCTFTPQGGTGVYKPFDGGPELSCDRREPQYVRLVVTPKTVQRFNNVGDQDGFPHDNILPYGSRWSHGPFTCDSAETGLTCKRLDGRGFFMSRATIRMI